ncbi:MAG: hypothetical protein HQL67_00785 [Magnetococcales bacterium]|nr:hypothetical protein [Magnetococcales bacterium]
MNEKSPPPPGRNLLRQINRLFNQTEEPDPFTLRSLGNQASELHNSDPASAYRALAKLACLEHNFTRMSSYHQILINLQPDQPQAYLDYSNSLRKVGRYSEARYQSERAFDLDPDNGDVLTNLVKDATISGRFRMAGDVIEKMIALAKPVYQRNHNFICNVIEHLDQWQISDDVAEKLQKKALFLLKQHNIVPQGIVRAPAVHLRLLHPNPEHAQPSAAIQKSQATSYLQWKIQLGCENEKIELLNRQLIELIQSDDFPVGLESCIQLTYMPWWRGNFLRDGFYL